jgi:hypothetical protein
MALDELVSVYTTNNPIDAESVRIALAAEGIRRWINGAGQAGMPGVIITKITVDVSAADAERSRAIIEGDPTGR